MKSFLNGYSPRLVVGWHFISDAMKNSRLIPFLAAAILSSSSCDKSSPDIAKKLAELERKNQESATRQATLERELSEQKLITERDAIEREKTQLEQDRAELARQQGEASLAKDEAARAKDEAIRQREQDIARREGKAEQTQNALAAKESELAQKATKLSDKDRELAGREALPFQQAEPSGPVGNYGTFYDSLSSYGSWFETPNYGYVWQPTAVRDRNWRPYTRGRWACSDRGWNWISEEPFGWATYHYGRWAQLRRRGWVWVPGNEWAPCWVSWRESSSHIGWAPLPPETLAYQGHTWDASVESQFGISSLWYNFVEIGNFGDSIYRHCLPVSGNSLYIGQSQNITRIQFQNRQIICGGPSYQRISQRIGRDLPFYRLEINQGDANGRRGNELIPRAEGDRLIIHAPNIGIPRNDGLRPSRLVAREDDAVIERDQVLSAAITDRYRQSRVESHGQVQVQPPRQTQPQEQIRPDTNNPDVSIPSGNRGQRTDQAPRGGGVERLPAALPNGITRGQQQPQRSPSRPPAATLPQPENGERIRQETLRRQQEQLNQVRQIQQQEQAQRGQQQERIQQQRQQQENQRQETEQRQVEQAQQQRQQSQQQEQVQQQRRQQENQRQTEQAQQQQEKQVQQQRQQQEQVQQQRQQQVQQQRQQQEQVQQQRQQQVQQRQQQEQVQQQRQQHEQQRQQQEQVQQQRQQHEQQRQQQEQGQQQRQQQEQHRQQQGEGQQQRRRQQQGQ